MRSPCRVLEGVGVALLRPQLKRLSRTGHDVLPFLSSRGRPRTPPIDLRRKGGRVCPCMPPDRKTELHYNKTPPQEMGGAAPGRLLL